MSRVFWISAIVLLVGFIGYSVWATMLGGRKPASSYPDAVRRLVTEAAKLAEAEKSFVQREEDRKAAAEKLRKDFTELPKASRPSYRKLGDVVNEVEFATAKDNSRDLVVVRMTKVLKMCDEIKSMLGTSLDAPD